MAVTALREVTLGVRAIEPRRAAYEACGLSVIAAGTFSPMTASRLFDTHVSPTAVVLGRLDDAQSLRIRLVSLTELQWRAPRSGSESGPLGIEFGTSDPTQASRALCAAEGSVPVETPIGMNEGIRGNRALMRNAEGDLATLTTNPEGGPSAKILPTAIHLAVHNLAACVHFMADLLDHDCARHDRMAPWMSSVLGCETGASVGIAVATARNGNTSACSFVEIEASPRPMVQIPGVAPGICRLRFDTTDMDATLSRVPGAGGSLVRGPASIDDPVLGGGLVAMVRSPFGLLIEIWQTQ